MKPTCGRLAIWMALLLAAGCASSPEPFEYVSERDFKEGPGLLSGEEGKLNLYPWGGLPGVEEKVAGKPAPQSPAKTP